MRFKIFAFIWFAALAAAPVTLSADEGCCDKPAMACCDKPATSCCDKAATAAPADCCQKGATHNHDGKAGCCEDNAACDMPCCKDGNDAGCDMPCCKDGDNVDAIQVLIAMDGHGALASNGPVRQTAVVFFQRPVWVGDTVLMGKYVIEHDTDRQARGEPCTHIYAFKDQKTPIATFHCIHLDGVASAKDTVVLRSIDGSQQRFVQFQFAGETAAHGFPTER